MNYSVFGELENLSVINGSTSKDRNKPSMGSDYYSHGLCFEVLHICFLGRFRPLYLVLQIHCKRGMEIIGFVNISGLFLTVAS